MAKNNRGSMKEYIVNLIYYNLQSYPSKELIEKNLGELNNNRLIAEINKIVKLIVVELNFVTEMLNAKNDIISKISGFGYCFESEKLTNQIRHITLSSKFTELHTKTDFELLSSYQYLFRLICWIGEILIKLKNEIINSKNDEIKDLLTGDVLKSLQMLNNILDEIDYITPHEIKLKMDISNDELLYIKQRNILWIIDDSIDRFERFSKGAYEDLKFYLKEIKVQTLKWRQEFGINNVSDEELERCYNKAAKCLKKMKRKMNKLTRQYAKTNHLDTTVEKVNDFETDESELRLPGIFGFAKFMIDWANEVQEQDAREKAEKLEKQMDNYLLEEWQKELVRKGEYDPWSFEEEGELEEGDYYYEDDR